MRLTARGFAHRRPGTTLVELTVVVVLLGIIVGGLLSVVGRQHRFYRENSSGIGLRGQLREAAEILPAEFRALSPPAGDVVQALDSLLEFHATIASGVVCERGEGWIALVPLRPRTEPPLGAELVAPEPGDVVHVLFVDPTDPNLDQWRAFAVTGTARDVAACPAGPFISPADAGRPRLRLDLAPAPPPALTVGTPVRITRPVRYSLYRSSDRRWYLGVNERTGGRWGGIQPVSGPYAPYASGRGGIEFRYWSRAGSELPANSELQDLSRIALTVRGGQSGTVSADSALVQVALRNRSR